MKMSKYIYSFIYICFFFQLVKKHKNDTLLKDIKDLEVFGIYPMVINNVIRELEL